VDERIPAVACAVFIGLGLVVSLAARATISFPGPFVVTAKGDPTRYWINVAVLALGFLICAVIGSGL